MCAVMECCQWSSVDEEGDDGKCADDGDTAGESRRFRTVKGDKRPTPAKMQVLAKLFKICLSSREDFRKDYDCVFKVWMTDVVFDRVHTAFGRRRSVRVPARRGQSRRGKCVCEEPAWQDHHLDAAEHHKRTADSGSHVHDAFRVFYETMASMQIIKTSVTEEKTAEAARVRKRMIKIEEALVAAKVAKPLAKWLTIGIDDVSAQARSQDTLQWNDTTDFTSFSRSSFQTRRREHVQLAACSTTFAPRTKRKSNAK